MRCFDIIRFGELTPSVEKRTPNFLSKNTSSQFFTTYNRLFSIATWNYGRQIFCHIFLPKKFWRKEISAAITTFKYLLLFLLELQYAHFLGGNLERHNIYRYRQIQLFSEWLYFRGHSFRDDCGWSLILH